VEEGKKKGKSEIRREELLKFEEVATLPLSIESPHRDLSFLFSSSYELTLSLFTKPISSIRSSSDPSNQDSATFFFLIDLHFLTDRKL